MNHTEFLSALAGVAATLIGFTGIVVVAAQRRTWSPLDRAVFYSMLAPSLTALFCAFIPELLATLSVPQAALWRTANGLLGAAHLANLLPMLIQLRSLKFNGLQKSFMGSGVLMILAHGAASVGVIGVADFIFLLGLIQQLAVGMFNFLQLVTADSSDPPTQMR